MSHGLLSRFENQSPRKGTPAPTEVSTLRLYLLRAMYAYIEGAPMVGPVQLHFERTSARLNQAGELVR